MARKNYSLAVMFALWLLALCTCFTFAYVSWAAIICVVLLTALFVAALWMLYFKNNMLLMHITVALTAVSILVLFIIMLYIFGSNVLGSAIAAMLLGIFYLLEQFLLKTEHVNRNDKFYLYGVILFAVLYVLLDDFIVGNPSSISYTSAAAVLVAALYSLLFYKIKLRPFAAYIAIGLYAVLTIILWVSYYRYYVGYGISLMELLIQLLLLGGYILFDVLRKKVPAKSAEAALGQTEPSLDEKLARLEELQALREAGVLTEEEFQTQKQKILGGNKHV